jgi:hypothetical protein
LYALIERLATKGRLSLLLLLDAALAGGFAWCAAHFEAPHGPSVVDLELSFRAGVFKQILGLWAAAHPQGVQVFKASVATLDMLFPPAYAAFISALYTWVMRTGGMRPLRAGQLAPWVAAALDWLENALLLLLLLPVRDADEIARATFSPTLVGVMSAAASLKLALLVVTAALTLVTLFVGARGRVLARCRFSGLSVVLGSVPLLALPQGRDLLLTLADGNATGPGARFGFFVFLIVWAASVWYWARVVLMVRSPHDPQATPDEQLFATWTPRILGTATVALAGVAFVLALPAAMGDPEAAKTMGLFAAVCLVLALAFGLFVMHRRSWLRRLDLHPPAVEERFALSRLPMATRLVALISLGVSLVFFALFVWFPVSVASRLGAITVLLVAAANTVFFGSLAAVTGRRLRLPLVALGFLGAAVFSAWNDNHDVRLRADVPARLDQRPALADAFAAWFAPLQAACGGCADVPVYLVAAEGGGIRAAYWTAGVLTHIQDQRPDFARHIFAISGVSGGSVGASVFASLVRDAAGGGLPCAEASGAGGGKLQSCARTILAGRFLAPTLAKLVSGDFAQWFIPLPVRAFDRSWGLEDSWAAAYESATGHDSLSASYLDAWPSPAAGVPALVLNGTHVQTGRRIVATPFSWTAADIPDATDLLAVVGADLPLKTVMHNSARFTYISPAGRLRTPSAEDRGHVVDGGYFENSGAATLQDLLHAVSDVPVAAGPRPRFVVLYLCNDPAACHLPAIPVAGDAAWRPAENLAEWFAPLRALLGAREARAGAALAELRRQVGPDAFVELGVCRRLENQERSAPLPLGWQLSNAVRAEMDRQVQDPVCGAAPVP